jgi:hypothetical protein
MIRIVYAVLGSCLVLAASRSSAGPVINPVTPHGPNCTVPTTIRLVGLGGDGLPSPNAVYRVTVRTGWNNPLPNSVVILSFADCDAIRIASSGYDAGVTVDCRSTHLTVRRLTNAAGEVEFIIPGTAIPGMSHIARCVKVSADGTSIGAASVTTADLSGAGGIDANDLSLWLGAFGQNDASLGDLNGDAVIGAGDLSEWLSLWGSASELHTPALLCP